MPTIEEDREILARVSKAMGCGPIVEALRQAVRADNYRAVATHRDTLAGQFSDLGAPDDEVRDALAAVMRAMHAETLDGPEVWIECDDHGPVRAALDVSIIIAAGKPRPAAFATCPMEH